MKNRLFLFAIGILFFANSNYGQNFVKVTKSNEGQTINLSSTQVLEVNLPRKAATGYVWCETTPSDVKSVQKSVSPIGEGDFIHDLNPVTKSERKGMTGTSGTQILRYVGTSQGTTTLNFELKRSWDNNSPVVDNYTITVVSEGKYKGNYTPQVKELPKHVTETPKTAPHMWDWRTQCTPVPDQQYCGDCWAFAGVGTLECNIKIHDAVTRDISEAYLTNCYTGGGSDGCNGGFCPHDYWMSPKGAVYESQCPWTTSLGNGTTGTCGSSYTYHETIDNYADVAGENSDGVPPDANIKNAIYNYGPIWISVDASSNAWNNYSTGVFTESSPAGVTDHAVVLVGWHDSTSVAGGGFWILRNSWGPSWGLSGYMYISYGSDLVGAYSNYIVYKGGITHSVAPVANFAASTTNSCTGTIQFTESSTNNPTTFLWTFGDGTTSTLQNPTHTYTANGTYTVTLKATNSYGNNTNTKTNYVTVSLPASPTVTGASCTGPCSVTLNASGNGTLKWYNAATGGTLLYTGTSFTTPVLSSTTTYYVQNVETQPVQSAGKSAKSTTGKYYSSTAAWALTFDALSAIKINSVTVYANTTASRCIWLKNSSGTMLDSVTTSIASGTQSVTLNFTVPAGTGYQLGTDAACHLWRDSAAAVYPYTLAGLVSITGNTAAATDYYYYFYNWQVTSTSASCMSARVPVVATINTFTGIESNNESTFEVFPNPNAGSFDIKLDNIDYQNATISVTNLLGQTLFEQKVENNNTIHIDITNFSQSMYYVKLQTEKTTYIKNVLIAN